MKLSTIYVADSMFYTDNATGNWGALATLKNLSGLCGDYSDLLVALNRAAGVPARHLNGPICGNNVPGLAGITRNRKMHWQLEAPRLFPTILHEPGIFPSRESFV